MRRAVHLAVLAAVLTTATILFVPPAHAQASGRRVVVVTIDGTMLSDWLAADAPSIRQIMREGSTGLLSARTGAATGPRRQETCLLRETAARRTLLEGERAEGDEPGPIELVRVLAEGGVGFRALNEQQNDSSFPTGRRTGYESLRRRLSGIADGVTVVLVDDALRADCATPPAARARWVKLAIERADALVSFIRARLDDDDTLIVVSTVPPNERERARDFLTTITAVGPGFEAGSVMTSASTRRPGVVALVDVAPTVARAAGAGDRVGVGQAIETGGGSLAGLRDADHAYEHAARSRRTLLRFFVWSAAALVAVAALTVLAGRSIASGGRVPRSARDALGIALSAAIATPLALLIEPAFGLRSTAASGLFAIAAALAIAGLAWTVAGPRRAPALVCGLTIVAVAADIAAGGPLSERSVISYSIAEGARFFGIGNELMGVVVVSALVWSASALDAIRRPVAPVVAVLAMLALLMAAPPLGAKFGSVFVAVPAFGIVVARATGAPLDRRAAIGVAIATTLVAAAMIALDRALAPDVQSHLARAAEDEGVLGRKASAALRLVFGSYWTGGIVLSAGTAALILWRRPVLSARALWGRPHLRTCLAAAAGAGVAAVLFNDAGITAASVIATLGGATMLHALLLGQSLPPPRSARVERLKSFAR